MTFFRLQTPRDMLEKAGREHARLRSSLDIDNVFNFFVTAYHIRDYVKESKSVPPEALAAFMRDPEIEFSRELCNKAKHMLLTKSADPHTRIVDGTFNSAPFNTVPFGSGEVWFLLSGSKQVNIELLAVAVLQKWTTFFQEHHL
jgi:hypothetical protein